MKNKNKDQLAELLRDNGLCAVHTDVVGVSTWLTYCRFNNIESWRDLTDEQVEAALVWVQRVLNTGFVCEVRTILNQGRG